MNWVESNHCASRQHCLACRTSEAFRIQMGAPDVCPFGVSEETAYGESIGGGDWGPGTQLALIFKKFRIRPATGCKCLEHTNVMNAKGADWCEENIETILDWLQEEAARAKLPFIRRLVRVLVRRAIARSRK